MCQRPGWNQSEPWRIEHDFLMPGEFVHLQRNGMLTDICLLVEGRSFPAHRVVLAAMSPYFQAMFTGPMSEARADELELSDVDATTIDQILSFLYTGKAEVQGFDSAVQLLLAADRFLISDLARFTLQLIKDKTSISDVPHLLVEGIRFRNDDLEAYGFAKCCEHFLELSEGFLRLPSDVLSEVLKSDFLNLDQEKQVLEVVVSWLEANVDPVTGRLPSHETFFQMLSTVRYSNLEPGVKPEFWPRLSRHCKDTFSAHRILCDLGRAGRDAESARWILRHGYPDNAKDLALELFAFATKHYEYGGLAVLLLRRTPRWPPEDSVQRNFINILQNSFEASFEQPQESGTSRSSSRDRTILSWAGILSSLIEEKDGLSLLIVSEIVSKCLKDPDREESQLLVCYVAPAVIYRCALVEGGAKTLKVVASIMRELDQALEMHIPRARSPWVKSQLQKAARQLHSFFVPGDEAT